MENTSPAVSETLLTVSEWSGLTLCNSFLFELVHSLLMYDIACLE